MNKISTFISIALLSTSVLAQETNGVVKTMEYRIPNEVSVTLRSNNQDLPLYQYRGDLYVVGEPKQEYTIYLKNNSQSRYLAVTSVDGVNVITGDGASFGGAGYIIPSFGFANVDGWRKSLDRVAKFYFTENKTYAEGINKGGNKGVIGVAFFKEKEKYFNEYDYQGKAESSDSANASSAPSAASREKSLGTGHGQIVNSYARQETFEKNSDTPTRVIQIYYDTYRNLVKKGVIVERPSAFPEEKNNFQFAPDPFR